MLCISISDISPFKNDHIIIHTDNESFVVDNFNMSVFYLLDLTYEQGIIVEACISLLKNKREFILIKSKLYDTSNNLLNRYSYLSKGSYGKVIFLTHFDVVLKVFTCGNFSLLAEVAVCELIKYAYQVPEEFFLPCMISHGKDFIVYPKYERTMKHNEKKDIYVKLAHAIYNLHSIGIIHRDIKMSNIMIHKGSPILIDFGLSVWGFCRVRKSITSVQTIYCRAPEIASKKSINKCYLAL